MNAAHQFVKVNGEWLDGFSIINPLDRKGDPNRHKHYYHSVAKLDPRRVIKARQRAKLHYWTKRARRAAISLICACCAAGFEIKPGEKSSRRHCRTESCRKERNRQRTRRYMVRKRQVAA